MLECTYEMLSIHVCNLLESIGLYLCIESKKYGNIISANFTEFVKNYKETHVCMDVFTAFIMYSFLRQKHIRLIELQFLEL